ncbi:MAG: hypothetical protein V1889_03110 [archaeon]
MSEICKELHLIFNEMKRFRFPFNENKIPLNGIYVLFENGEETHGGNRIVRVGTHTGVNQLRSRIRQHFVNENKDRSIFRKNIGRALLSKNKDLFLEDWEKDLTTRKAKEKFSETIDFEKRKAVEKLVTDCLRKNFSFVVFGVGDKDKRLEFESKIISTISLCDECRASKNWLGNFSPKTKIRESGLWLVNELYKDGFDEDGFREFVKELKLSVSDGSL